MSLRFSLAFIFKVLSALSGVLLTYFITKSMSISSAGCFLFGFSATIVISTLLRLGLDNVVVRHIAEYKSNIYSQSKLNTALTWCFTASFIAATLSYFFANSIVISLNLEPEMVIIFKFLFLSLPAFSIFTLLSRAFQGEGSIIKSIVFQNFGVTIVFLFLTVLIDIFFNITNDLKFYSLTFTCASWLTCLAAIMFWFTISRKKLFIRKFYDKKLFVVSFDMWQSTALTLIVGWFGFFLVGFFESSEEIAKYSTALRVTNSINFFLVAANLIVAPKFARLWRVNKVNETISLYKRTTKYLIFISIPIVTFFFIFNESIMSFFGKDYRSAGNILLILAIGQAINVASGSVGYLLNMTGHHKQYRHAVFASSLITVILGVLLTKYLGILGAAISTSIGISIQNIFAFIFVNKHILSNVNYIR